MKNTDYLYDDLTFLLDDFRNGEENAFNYIFRTRYKKLCCFASVFINDEHLAEDIVQDVFEKIWKLCCTQRRYNSKLSTLYGIRSIDAYLFVSVKNKCLFLKKKREKEISLNKEIGKDTNYYLDDIMNDDKEQYKLWQEVEKLPTSCKRILKLVVIDSMKYKEVALALEISINTVKTQLKIAYKTLRKNIKAQKDLILFLLFTELEYS